MPSQLFLKYQAKKILQFLEILVTKKLFTQAAKNIFNLIEFFTNFCSINLIEIWTFTLKELLQQHLLLFEEKKGQFVGI